MLSYINNNTEVIVNILKAMCFIIFSYFTNYKILNKNIIIDRKFNFNIILMVFITILYVIIKIEINHFIAIASLIFMIALAFSIENIGNSVLVTILSISINYILSLISIIVCFFVDKMLKINNDFFSAILIVGIHFIMMLKIFKLKKFKYGISFLKNNKNSDYIDVWILTISVIILFCIIIFTNSSYSLRKNLCVGLLIFSIIMFITIQKSLQLYYKQKLLVQELEKVKKELENKEKEIRDLESENIKISKKNHTLSHKQKSLEYKIEEIISNSEISKEEVREIRDRLKEIGKNIQKEKTAIELDKTEIIQIDDMLKYMQSECKKNNIEFELQLKGNIHYMTNNLIAKEDLETLLADHIKNAIIAIKHTDNINRSILVKLGKIDETYGLYIYDSGIEFERKTLENLGKKPSTTHENEGGTGIGFMNTFDTLKKCNASLIIEELNEPTSENYTKAIMIKFDNKNEFNIKSYREKLSINTL